MFDLLYPWLPLPVRESAVHSACYPAIHRLLFCLAQRFFAAKDINLLRSSGLTSLQRAGPPRLPNALITAFNSRLLGFFGVIYGQSRAS